MIIEIFCLGEVIHEVHLPDLDINHIEVAYRVQSKMSSEKAEQYAPKLGKASRRYESQQRKPFKYRNPEPVAPAKVVEHPKGEYSNTRLYDF